MRRYGHVSLRKNSIIFFPSTHTNESFMKVHVRQAMRRERAERRGNKGKKKHRGKVVSSLGKFSFFAYRVQLENCRHTV